MTNEQAIEAVAIIDELLAEECSSVTLFNDDPYFGGPDSAIEVVAEWTDWTPRRFTGDNMLGALRAARTALHERMTPPESNA